MRRGCSTVRNGASTSLAFYDNAADVNTFTSARLSGTLSAEQKYSRSTTLIYRMSWQRVSIDPNSLVIDPTLIPLYSKPVFLAIPSFTYLRDTRDNPIDSHKGSYTIADLGLATSALGSEANFGRVLLQNSTYYTFKKHWVLARNTQIGILHRTAPTIFWARRRPESCLRRPRRCPCRNCSSPAAATRFAVSPLIRPVRVIR